MSFKSVRERMDKNLMSATQVKMERETMFKYKKKIEALELEQVRHIEIIEEANSKRIKELEAKLTEAESKLRVQVSMNEAMPTQTLAFENEYREKLKVAVDDLELISVQRISGVLTWEAQVAIETLKKIKAK